VDSAAFEKAVAQLTMEHFGERLAQFGYVATISIRPLERIYLHSGAVQEIGRTGSARRLRILGLIGLFVLAIVGMNFVNLSTARSLERAREVGIRKVVGSRRSLVAAQFVCEAVVISLIGLLFSAAIVAVALPHFNVLADKSLALGHVFTPAAVAAALALALVTGLLAGAYPALVLSRFRPAAVLKGSFARSKHGLRLRQGLVVVQFALSIGLIVGTMVVYKQLRYMQTQRLGFDKERVLVLDVPDEELSTRAGLIRERLSAVPGVQSVSSSELVPGHQIGHGTVYVGEQASGTPIEMNVGAVDEHYVETMGLETAAGRPFSAAFGTDRNEAALINETAARRFGFASPEEAVGRRVVEASDMRTLTIVGIMRDYHHESLREPIPPTLVRMKPVWYEFVSLRLVPGDVAGTVARVEDAWESLFPGYASDFFFLDDAFDQQYGAERRLMTLFGLFAGLAIVIACLGLVGLVSSTAAQRTKEIGVRKVLGASTAAIVALLTRDVAVNVLLALVVGGPVAYVVMDGWLADFAYRIEMPWPVIALSGAAALGLALLTVSYHALKAAATNPVRALRYE
jgi:putative ABC transport system permease protein